MTTTTKLTATQRAVLEHAVKHLTGTVEWFPENLNGGARKKVLDGLATRTLIKAKGSAWVVTPAGYKLLGVERSKPAASSAEGATPTIRENTKQALVIDMLKRAEGATIDQMAEATGWQKHTVRGTLAGALKKRLKLNVASAKTEDGERVYRIQ